MKKLILIALFLLVACPGPVPVEEIRDTDAFLTWQAPTLNEDGSPLTDLSHYVILQGDKAGEYTVEHTTTETQYLIEGLDPDKVYYFTVKAVDVTGNVSEASNEAAWGN